MPSEKNQSDLGQQSDGTEARAMSALWTKSHPIVAAFIRSTILDFHRAEDLLQDTAATVAEKFEQFDPSRPFVPWVLGIARNKVLHHLRTCSNDRHVFSEHAISQLSVIYAEFEPEMDDRHIALEQCLSAVRGRSRKLLKMRYVRQQTPAMIANEIGMTANAVAVMLHRVRRALQDCIEKHLLTAN